MPVGATGSSVAPVDTQRAAAVEARRSTAAAKCDPAVKAGICAATTDTPPPPDNARTRMGPKIAQERAQRLIDWAKSKSQNDRMILFSNLDLIFRQEPPLVRQAIRANPAFAEIVNGAANALIGSCLNGHGRSRGDLVNPADQALHFLLHQTKTSHPELAAAFVVSAAAIFKSYTNRDVPIFSFNDTVPHTNRTYIAELQRYIGHSNREANKAIKELEALVAKPNS
jgi:hypothetical protein